MSTDPHLTTAQPAHPIARLGVQLFTLAGMAARDFEATLKLIAESGYAEVEFFGPYPFSAPESIASWGPLAAQMGISQNAYFGMTVQEVKARLDADRLRPDLEPLDLLFARSTMRHIKELIVGGRTVTRDGKVIGIDLPAMNDDLMGRFRHGIAQNAALAAALPRLERAVRDHFETPCC